MGNVLATILDRRTIHDVDTGCVAGDSVFIALWDADIINAQDYYPFGMLLPNRVYQADSTGTGDYRYGFNGHERDDEVYGAGNSTTADYWQYDTRLGRRWNLDPLGYEWQSGYSTFNNNPVYFSDPFGLEGEPANEEQEEGEGDTKGFESCDGCGTKEKPVQLEGAAIEAPGTPRHQQQVPAKINAYVVYGPRGLEIRDYLLARPGNPITRNMIRQEKMGAYFPLVKGGHYYIPENYRDPFVDETIYMSSTIVDYSLTFASIASSLQMMSSSNSLYSIFGARTALTPTVGIGLRSTLNQQLSVHTYRTLANNAYKQATMGSSTFYRAMGRAEYSALKSTNGLNYMTNTELFVSSSKAYSQGYLSKPGYDILVEFTMKPGAMNYFNSVGVMHRTAAGSSGWAARGNLLWKSEQGAMNLGIQNNTQLFNPWINSFKAIK
ncbi:MAG: hypothetical protein KDC92_15765 [Bacteroidetes bacterium]|nr:hypothetical protein [Bacteroidota bacterium]